MKDEVTAVEAEISSQLLDQGQQSSRCVWWRCEEKGSLAKTLVALGVEPVVAITNNPEDVLVRSQVGCWCVEIDKLLCNGIPNGDWADQHIWKHGAWSFHGKIDLIGHGPGGVGFKLGDPQVDALLDLLFVVFQGLLYWLCNPGLEGGWVGRNQFPLLQVSSLNHSPGKRDEEMLPEPCCKCPETRCSPRIMPVFKGGLEDNVNLVLILWVGRQLIVDCCDGIGDAQSICPAHHQLPTT